MDNAAIEQTGGRSRRLVGSLVFLAAVLPHLWTIGLEFAGDDYTVVPAAAFMCGLKPTPPRPDFELPTAVAERAASPQESAAAAAESNYLFRPMTSAFWAALNRLGGGRSDRLVFRIATLLVHGLVAWLLYRVLLLALPIVPSAIAAAWFGFAPLAHQAFSWIAAAGDLLTAAAALLGLLLLVGGARRLDLRGDLSLLAGAACVGALIGFKESGVVLIPFVMGAFLLLGKPSRRRFLIASTAAAAVFGFFLLWRFAMLGHWFPRYPLERPFRLESFGALPAMLGQMIAPVNRATVFHDLRPMLMRLAEVVSGDDATAAVLRMRWIAAAALAPALSGLFNPRGRIGVLMFAVAAAAAALAPAAWLVFVDDGSFMFSRSAYQGALGSAGILAVALAAFRRPGVVLLVSLPLALVAADMTVHVARVERAVSRDIADRLASVRAFADSEPAGTRLVVIDPEDSLANTGISLVGVGYPWAFSRFFDRRPVPVERWMEADASLLEDMAARETSRVVFLRRSGRGFTKSGDPLLPGPAQPIFIADPSIPGAYKPAAPTPVRFVKTLLIPSRPAGGALRAWWTFAAENGEATTETAGVIAAIPERGLCVAPSPVEFHLRPLYVNSVRFEGLEPSASPEALRQSAWITVVRGVGAGDGGKLEIGGAPSLAFKPPWPVASYRVEFRIGVPGAELPIVYSFGAERCAAEKDGVLMWKASPDDHVVAAPELGGYGRIELLEPLWAAQARSQGVKRVQIRYRIEGIGAGVPLCASPWANFVVVEKDG